MSIPLRPNRSFLATAIALGMWLGLPAVAQEARVQGKVVDAAGSPLAKLKLVFEPQQEGSGVRVGVETNKKGTFFIGLLRPGIYNVRLDDEAHIIERVHGRAVGPDREVAWDEDGAIAPGQPFVLQAADGQQITLELTVAAAVRVQTAGGDTGVMSTDAALAELGARVQRGECETVMPELGEVVKSAPQSAVGHYLLGYCQASQNATDDALTSLRKAMEIDARLPGASLLAGQILGRMGRVDEAEERLRQEIELAAEPKLVQDAWLALGMLHVDQQRNEQAIEAFQRVKELAPSRPEAYVQLASLYTEAGQPERAEALLAEARGVGAVSAAALINVGINYYNRNDCDHASQLFGQVLDLEASPAELAMAHALLGRCHLQGGRHDEALASYQRSLELDPASTFAEEARTIVASLKK